MAANITPIFTGAPDIQWNTGGLATANTAKDGTGTVATAFVADATNGGYIQKVRLRPLGTNVATVARIFINNGSTNTTAANNILYDEITCSATTLSEVAAIATFEVPMNIALPPGYKVLVTIGTTVAAGFAVSAVGGKY
ncbi:MAG: hypothetical protein ABL912_01920 [Novosphingobium sp.]